jgi:hypothetical protein
MDKNKFQFLVEVKPGIYPLYFQGRRAHEVWDSVLQRYVEKGSPSRPAKVPIPWQYFLFQFKAYASESTPWHMEDYALYWAKDRVQNWNSLVMPAMLPNIYRDRGTICFGSTSPSSNLPLDIRIEEIVDNFFGPASRFNADLGWNIPYEYQVRNRWGDYDDRPRGGAASLFRNWVAAGKENPLCWLKWNWKDYSLKPIRDMVVMDLPERAPILVEGTIDPVVPVVPVIETVPTMTAEEPMTDTISLEDNEEESWEPDPIFNPEPLIFEAPY